MIYFLCIINLLSVSNPLTVGLFTPLFPRCFAQGDNGSFFILDSKEHQVRHYSKDLNLLNSFGSQGEGPGEFFFPERVYFFDHTLYVEDAIFFTLFDSTGKPTRKIRKPFDADWYPTGKSWIAHKRYSSNGESEILWLSKDFTNQKVLDVDLDTTFQEGAFNPDGRPIPPAFTKQGHRLAKASKDRFSILVFDTHKGTLLHEIKKEVKLIPFDEEWGKETATKMLAMMQAHDALTNKPTTFNFPKYFSPIIRLGYTVDDHLVAYGLLRPGRVKPDYAFDLEGRDIDIKGNPEDYTYKVLMTYEGFAYLSLFEDEEAVILKVPLSQVEAVLLELE